MKTIIEKLHDLHEEATTRQSHFYVASCIREAIAEIVSRRSDAASLADQNAKLREENERLKVELAKPYCARPRQPYI
jgi:hypothetical protein